MARASDAAYAAIKSWIQTAELPPGALVDEAVAARRLSMSRTPVREALLRLQAEGYLEIARGKGIRVLPLSAGDMRDIYQVISGLETVAVSLLAERRPRPEELASLAEAVAAMRQALATGEVESWGEADERFHRELMRLSGNPRLYAVGCHFRDLSKRAHMVAMRLKDDAYRANSTESHAELLRALTEGEAPSDAAERHFRQRRHGEAALVGTVRRFSLGSL
jgi:DNA-binding GntR family transcriptional regulator